MILVSAEYSAVATLAVRLTCCDSSVGFSVSNHSLFEEGVGEETPPSVGLSDKLLRPPRVPYYIYGIQHGYLLACFSLLLSLPESNMWVCDIKEVTKR